MTPTTEREVAADLARRLKLSLIDESKVDEAHLPAHDRPPAFIDAVMSRAPSSIEHALDLKANDWQLIAKALEQFAAGKK